MRHASAAAAAATLLGAAAAAAAAAEPTTAAAHAAMPGGDALVDRAAPATSAASALPRTRHLPTAEEQARTRREMSAPPPPPPSPPSGCAAPPSLALGALQLSGPADGSEPTRFKWWNEMLSYRKRCLADVRPDGKVFEQPGLRWTQTAYMQPLMMPFDLAFYSNGTYTVDGYLDSLNEQYGGIDSALLWPTYTNIGADDRDQFAMIESLPDGIDDAVDALHARGVHVLWPYNPWDQGTEGGNPHNATAAGTADAARLASLLRSTSSDGFFGDTISSAGLEQFYNASVAAGRPAAIQPEAGGTPGSLNFTTMGWGYWKYPFVPPVDLMKWLEPRWLSQVCDRWSRDKANWIQIAYFNGDGVETWQNIWGIWNGLTAYDAEVLRRMGSILRFFGRRGFFQSQGWQPHYPTQQRGVFASMWPLGAGDTVFTLVNRNATAASHGVQLMLSCGANDVTRGLPSDIVHVYDCYHGHLLLDYVVCGAPVSFDIEPGGFGCVFVTPNASLPANTSAFLATMAKMTAKPLASFSKAWAPLQQRMVPPPPTPPLTAAPPDMREVPGGAFNFTVSGVEIEGAPQDAVGGVDVQYPWEPFATTRHSHAVTVRRFFIDTFPVTCANYSAFLVETGYEPAPDRTRNWLKNWTKGSDGRWCYPPGHANKPVTYVSLGEARAYCAHLGRRLPTEIEWQFAAQGTDGRLYPWGGANASTAADGVHAPRLATTSNACPGPDDVNAHPAGASPFGVRDMAGNVWQFTSEFADEHTRAVVVRGGSNYYPSATRGTNWYFPNGPEMRRNDRHGKYFLMSDTFERCGTIGFRCAADAEAQQGGASKSDQ